ncbi:MAG: hypothetical protein FRX49_10420 [Trebouxia sp. A1-2]|nr:MAG: hypothetical protein FRX49_10420 [Trebouxia sp. A1-2]
MAALNCQSSCCLDPSGDSCYIPGLGGITQISVFDNDTCCPTSPSTYAFDGEACGCGTTPQLCPALPPSPQESPSPLDSSPELLLSIPPPPSPPPVVMTASTAAKVPVVTATQKLADFTVATFDTTAKDSFLTTLSNNIEKLSGPIQVSIPNGGITPGSVNVQTSVVFLNGDADSVEAYKSAMRSSSSSVFGTFAAVVDPNTISESNTTNPQSGSSSGADPVIMGGTPTTQTLDGFGVTGRVVLVLSSEVLVLSSSMLHTSECQTSTQCGGVAFAYPHEFSSNARQFLSHDKLRNHVVLLP